MSNSKTLNIYMVRSDTRRDILGRPTTLPAHHSDSVIAMNLEDAIAAVKRQRPNAHIWTAAHKGKLDASFVSPDAMRVIIEETE